jgi:hypothetical protein
MIARMHSRLRLFGFVALLAVAGWVAVLGAVRVDWADATSTACSVRDVSGSRTLRGATHSLAALSETDVWAVGTDWSLDEPAIAHWDGRAWRQYSLPLANVQLRAVSAPSASSVWAIGWNGSRGGGVVVTWNGRSWRRVLDAPKHEFTDLVAFARNDVWVVGETEAEPTLPVVAHWNGRRWSMRRLRAGAPAHPAAIAGSSSRNLWVAGWTESPAPQRPLILRGNGKRWWRVAAPPTRWPHAVASILGVAGQTAWVYGWTDNGKDPRSDADFRASSYWSFWSGREWRSRQTLGGSVGGVDVIARSPSSRFFAAADNTVYVWKMTSWSRVASFPRGYEVTDLVPTSGSTAWIALDDGGFPGSGFVSKLVCT